MCRRVLTPCRCLLSVLPVCRLLLGVRRCDGHGRSVHRGASRSGGGGAEVSPRRPGPRLHRPGDGGHRQRCQSLRSEDERAPRRNYLSQPTNHAHRRTLRPFSRIASPRSCYRLPPFIAFLVVARPFAFRHRSSNSVACVEEAATNVNQNPQILTRRFQFQLQL